MPIKLYEYGLGFPLELDSDGSPIYDGLSESVDKSVKIILSWSRNHRAFDNKFGSLTSFLWLPAVQTNISAYNNSLRSSLMDNDKRIDDVVVNSYADKDRVFIEALVHIDDNTNLHSKLEL